MLSAVVDVKLVAKLAERLVLQQEIVVEAGLESPQVRTPIRRGSSTACRAVAFRRRNFRSAFRANPRKHWLLLTVA